MAYEPGRKQYTIILCAVEDGVLCSAGRTFKRKKPRVESGLFMVASDRSKTLKVQLLAASCTARNS